MSSPAGKQYDPHLYAVGREKVREYALAVGETSAVHHDPEAARKIGFKDVVAPFVDVSERAGRRFFTHGSRSTSQDGDLVVVGTWTRIVR